MSDEERRRLEQLRARNREITEHSGNFSPLEMIQQGKATRYSATRVFRKYLLAAVMLVLTLAVLAAVVFVFLRVDTVSVSDEADFSAEEVRAASGIRSGQNLLLLDTNAVEKRIAATIPYAVNVKVTKRYPSKVKISLSKGQGCYYTRKGADYYVITEKGQVIARTTDVESLELGGLVRLESSKIARCVVGEPIAYSDQDMAGMFEELTECLKAYGWFGFCDSIAFNSKFDIRFSYQDRILVKLGDLYDFQIKFQFVEKILETLQENDSGEIDVSDRNLHEGVLTLY